MTASIAFEMRRIGELTPNARNARTHSKRQLKQIAGSITTFGFTNPVLADPEGTLIAGHGRLEAARSLNMTEVPTIIISGLSEREKRQLMLADNKIALNSGWDVEKLWTEINDVVLELIDPGILGFEAGEIDRLMTDLETDSSDPANEVPPPSARVTSRRGDVWLLGKHKLLCGDARLASDHETLMGEEKAAIAFLDSPYNVRIASIVGRGKTKHDEFAMASGEMSDPEFHSFLRTTLGNAAAFSADGAVHFVCIDWGHVERVLAVGREVYSTLLNVVTWVKSNGGQGSFYRSQHEFIPVFRVGAAPHLNNVQLGKHGRNRPNVWHYAGINSFSKNRLDDLNAHPMVKPMAMVADAIKDCSKRDDIVLDTFGGSGTTILACERVGRRARSIGYDPAYVDIAIRRWQAFTGKDAFHAVTGLVFDDCSDRDEAEAA